MASMYLSQVDFHILEEHELDELSSNQNKQIAKSWFKRLLIIAFLIGIFVVFQVMARKSVPHMFGESTPVQRLYRISGLVFLVANILSYLELYFRFKVTFEKDRDKAAKLKVVKKMVVVKNAFIPYRQRFLVCEQDGNFLLDYVYVNSPITFSNIKKGSYVYVKQLHDDGHHKYELVS